MATLCPYSPELVMPLQHLFLRTFEAAQSDRQTDRPPRLFSLVPTKKGFECSHIKICANGLYSLLKRNGIKYLPKDADTFRPVADAYWRRFFHISKFETSNRRFAGEILTDGKGVSIVLRRPKAEDVAKGAPIDPNAFGEVWGLDPGRREMFVASNDAQQVQRVTTRQFYHDAKYRESNAKIKGWQDRDPDILEAIRNMPSKKHSRLEGLQVYVAYLLPMLDFLLRWHMCKAFRDLKFKRYVFAKKALSAICQEAICGWYPTHKLVSCKARNLGATYVAAQPGLRSGAKPHFKRPPDPRGGSEHPGGFRRLVEPRQRRHHQEIACGSCQETGERAEEALQGGQRR